MEYFIHRHLCRMRYSMLYKRKYVFTKFLSYCQYVGEILNIVKATQFFHNFYPIWRWSIVSIYIYHSQPTPRKPRETPILTYLILTRVARLNSLRAREVDEILSSFEGPLRYNGQIFFFLTHSFYFCREIINNVTCHDVQPSNIDE